MKWSFLLSPRAGVFFALVFVAGNLFAQTSPGKSGAFPRGSLQRVDQLPQGRLRSQVEQLPPVAQERAVRWLNDIHFCEKDLPAMHADKDGGIYFVCDLAVESAGIEQAPAVSEAAVTVSPFPSGLVFHSRPGASNVIYLNFTGETVSGTAWNTSLGRDPIPAVAFSTDSDFSTFNDLEQLAIKRIWQRVAEDYAPFNVDVTTERPATLGTRVANVLITRNTDANGNANPSTGAGGVAYVNVFAGAGYASYRPAWVYFNNLANDESYISEAASHEAGHNFGLSHDATSTSSYYGGHGDGDISWGPIMGTGYGRNVSQWSKGEYYAANNTQDDLSILSGKMNYRADDVGNTAAAAAQLVISSGTNVVSTTPENDPANASPANKGVLGSNTDVDVFSFNTGAGPVSFTVNPWIQPSGITRGGNLDVSLELRDAAGNVLAASNPPDLTTATVQADLPAGLYYLFVKNTGTGNPLSSTPTGYTAYGSLGQYFINGYVAFTTNQTAPPQAQLAAGNITQTGQGAWQFTVTYSDDAAVDVSTMDSSDIRVTGPNGFDRLAQFVSLNQSGNGTPRTATYAITPPDSNAWVYADNGTYLVFVRTNQVADTGGLFVPASQLGQFQVNVPSVLVTLYSANMDANPGWTLESDWQYGTPAYAAGSGPTAGYTGTKILGYNLAGNYPDNLAAKYAVTPAINCSGSSALTLRFQRWLVVRSGDTAAIQASTNGVDWVDVWVAGGNVTDTAWQFVELSLPAGLAGSSSLRLRWVMASNTSQNRIGWNIDDVEVLGDGRSPGTVNYTLTVGASPETAGAVSTTAGIYPAGTSLQLVATPGAYYRFDSWTGDVTGTNNPVSITVNSNINVVARFSEILTATHPTPQWWLASYGFTNNFETAVNQTGANGYQLWQSYIAGLNPTNPASKLLLTSTPKLHGSQCVLGWNTVTGRIYSIWTATNPAGPFTLLPGATNLPSSTQAFTNQVDGSSGPRFYRLEVSKP